MNAKPHVLVGSRDERVELRVAGQDFLEPRYPIYTRPAVHPDMSPLYDDWAFRLLEWPLAVAGTLGIVYFVARYATSIWPH